MRAKGELDATIRGNMTQYFRTAKNRYQETACPHCPVKKANEASHETCALGHMETTGTTGFDAHRALRLPSASGESQLTTLRMVVAQVVS